LEIIQDCYAIYRRIEEELKLIHVGTEGNELADRMPCSARSVKKRTASVSGKYGYSDTVQDAGGVNKKALVVGPRRSFFCRVTRR